MRRVRFWLVWSARDLRRRWLQVLAIALVIAIGVAVFAGLGGMRHFREESAQKSFAALKFHDLRVTLSEGDYARAGMIEKAVAASGVAVASAEERLLLNTQIDAEPTGKEAITPGLIVGVPVNGRDVDLIQAIRGRNLAAGDADEPVAVLDRSYARFYRLPDAGTLKLAGGQEIDYVGQGQSPQYFLITSETGFGGESTLGVLYVSLPAAQKLAGKPGEVNELVLRLKPGVDVAQAAEAVQQSVDAALPGAEVTHGTAEQAHTILFRDAKNDQRMLSFFGLLVLLGASIATFNLISRTVESERREIGVGMALGVPTRLLALRPMLLGVEIALAGTVMGVLLSALIANLFASVIKEFLPLPIYTDPFTFKVFMRGALVGMLLPVAATIWPIWRGVRVQPVEAIRVTARSAQGGMVRASTRLKLPGGTVAQMPWRNASRTPRRTLLAVVGLGAVLGATLALIGVVDSFNHTIDQSRAEVVGDAPGRLSVTLNDFVPEASPEVRAVEATPGVERSTPRLDLGANLVAAGAAPIPVLLSVSDLEGGIWRPTVDEGSLPAGDAEIAIAPKAADDLGVEPGGTVTLQVAGRGFGGAPEMKNLKLKVSGLTSDPFRAFAFADTPLARAVGLAGTTNGLSVLPEAGVDAATIQRALAANPIVAVTRPVTADSDALSDTMEQFTGIIQIAAAAAFLLAVLMAFNLAGISMEERRREYATMFAYGLPARRGLGIASTENLIIGILGTLLGLVVGLLTITWIIHSLFGETWPELGIVRHLTLGSAIAAVAVGVGAVALTPYLLSRRLTRMDIPSTLRVVE